MRFLGIEQILTLDGRRYRLGRLTLAVLRKWLEWALDQLRPFPREHLPDLDLDALHQLESALEPWNTTDNPEIRALYDSDEGRAHLWTLLFERYHWDIDAAPLLAHCHDLERVFDLAAGIHLASESQAERSAMIQLGALAAAEPEPAQWAERFRALFENLNIPPHVAAEMTLPELATVCEGKHTEESARAQAAAYTRLTREQRAAISRQRIHQLLR